MIRTSRLLPRGAWVPLALLVAAGCKQGPSPEVQARIDSRSQASGERDGLMQEVAENTRLGSRVSRETLKDTLENMATISNTVYYVVGTKDELERKGLIQEEGGARFLFVLWKSGKTLVPARNLDPSEFTQADRRHLTELPLPQSDKEYRIVSRQDTSALETPPDHDGKLSGHAVKISDTARFWANSKYLIIVEG